MAPSGFQEDVDAFAIKVNSVLSYYEYTFYTDVYKRQNVTYENEYRRYQTWRSPR